MCSRAASLAAALALFAAAPAPAPAQQSSAGGTGLRRDIRIGFVDVEFIIDRSAAVRRLIESVDKEIEPRAAQLRDKQREFREHQLRLDEQGRLISETERMRLRDRMAALIDEMDVLRFQLDRDVARKKDLVEPMLDEIVKIIGVVGDREGFDMILRGEVVLYGRDTVDLTNKVLEEVDRRADELLAAARRRPSALPGDTQTTTTTERRGGAPLPLIP
ncbi:MAG: OmpH family outer membrane protein [Candidatus Sumerlaeia bacterium]|nr:OmpH family outer membrane protein [Candidatus Sumerlaeia bacterium]